MTPAEAGKTFQRATLGRTGLRVGRLGVAASYGVPAAAVERAFEQGVNYFYWGTFRRGGFGEAIRHLAPQRDRFILVIQSYARIAGLMGWSVERALRALPPCSVRGRYLFSPKLSVRIAVEGLRTASA